MDDDRDVDVELLHLVAQQIVVEGDIVEVIDGVWAVHGHATYDGDVMLAEYESFARAKSVLGLFFEGLDGAALMVEGERQRTPPT